MGELEALLRRAGDRPERLGRAASGGSARSTARRPPIWPSRGGVFPGEPLTGRLEALVLRARATVYARAGRRASFVAFFTRGYWRRLAERPLLVLAAWLLLPGPALAGGVWGAVDPPAAAGLVPAQFQAAADPPAEGRDYDAATASAFSFSVMFNNIQVTLVAFAGGITFGVLTVYALFFNGLLLGVIGGLAIGAGNGVAFLRLISSHGPLEISCIVVGGIAGLRIGWALIRPGRCGGGRRCGARRARGRDRGGHIPWLVLCGFLEGFATGPDLPVEVQATLGAFAVRALLGARGLAGALSSEDGARLRAQIRGDDQRGQALRRRLEHPRAGRPDLRGGACARGEHVARDVARARGERIALARPAASASSAGSDGLATTTAWRRVSTGTAATSGRAAASSSRSEKTTTSARLEPSARRNASS